MNNPEKRANPGYEATDVRTGLVWIVAGGLAVCVALIIFGTHLMLGFLHRRDLRAQQQASTHEVTKAVADTRADFPEPRLQSSPHDDLAAMRARENVELSRYGWVDRQAGVVRLPIERAMDLLTQRGLPVRGDPNAPKPTRTPLDMQQGRPLLREPIKEGR